MLALTRPIVLAVLITLALVGCTANLIQRSDYLGIAKEHISSNRMEAAYRFLEDVPEKDVAEARELMNRYPQILQAGLVTFSPNALRSSIEKYGIIESYDIELKRLGYLLRYASSDQYVSARQHILSRYDEAEIQKAIAKRTEEWNKVEYGRIADIQIADESKYNAGAGASVGQAYGSAIYVDNALSGSNWNYSAEKHTGAALIGALIGHMIEGETKINYHVRYWISLMNGESISIGTHQVSGFHIPIGACVEIKRRTFIRPANQKFCGKG